MDQQLRVTDTSDPESFVGKTIDFNGHTYLITSIIGMGVHKIVYLLKDPRKGKTPFVLKIYRQRIPKERVAELREIVARLRTADVNLPETCETFYINGWPVEVQTYLGKTFHFTFSPTGSFWHAMSRQDERVSKIADLYRDRKPEAVVRKCKQYLRDSPLKPEFLAFMGAAQLAIGNIAAASDALTLAIQVEPDNGGYYAILALARMADGEAIEARMYAHKGVELAPEDSTTWEAMFTVELAYGHIQTARHCLRKMRKMDLSRKNVAIFSSMLKEKTEGVRRGERGFQRAYDYWHNGQVEKALKVVSQVTVDAPYHIGSWLLYGVIAIEQGHSAHAVDVLSHGLALEPANPDVQFYLGQAYLSSGNRKASSVLHNMWLDRYLDAITHILRYRDSDEEVILEDEDQLRVIQDKACLMEESSVLYDLYSHTSSRSKRLSMDRDAIKRKCRRLTQLLSQVELDPDDQSSE